MIEENKQFNLEPSTLEDEYLKNQRIKQKFEESEAAIKYEERQREEDEISRIDEEEQAAVDNNSPGFFDYASGFVENIGVGAAKGVEETLQTARVIDNNAWNLPEPENIVESLGHGIGQFLPMFFGGTWAIRGGLMMANVLSKSGQLTRAGRHLTNLGAGAFSDAVAFDPKDQNMGNMALSIGAIANSPTTASFIQDYLAQNDADSEAKARMKSALTGMIAGEITGQMIRGAGYAYRKIKGTPKEAPRAETETVEYSPDQEFGDQPTFRHEADEFGPAEKIETDFDPKVRGELEEAANELAKDTVEMIDEANTRGASKSFGSQDINADQGFPDMKSAYVEDRQKTYTSESWERIKKEDPRYEAEMIENFHKMIRGEGLPPEEMVVTKRYRDPETGKMKDKKVPLIHSVNFLKHKTTQEARESLQYLARKFDIKRMVKTSKADTDLNLVLDDMIEDFHRGDLDVRDAIIDELGTGAGQVLDNIKYVGAVKIMNLVSLQNQKAAYEKFAKSGDWKDHEAVLDLAKQHEMLQRAGGLLSYGYGKGLAAHRRPMGLLKDKQRLANDFRNKITKSNKKVIVRSAKTYAKKVKQDERINRDMIKKGELEEEVQFDIRKDGNTEATYKTSRKTKVTALDTKKNSKVAKRIKSYEEQIAAIVKRKKTQISQAKSPTRGTPYPRKKSLSSPEIKQLDAQLAKIRADRAPLDKKFKRQAKEQLKHRKEFERLSSEIKQLQDTGTIVKKGFKKLKPVEIQDLISQKKKLLKETKNKLSKVDKENQKIDQLNKQFSDLLMKRIQAEPEIKATNAVGVENPLIKELKQSIKREKQRLSDRATRAELEDALKLKAEANMYEEINKMNLRQLRTRVANLHKHLGAKTKDAMVEVYINGLLSSTKTIGIVNPIGNTTAFVSTVLERAVAGATGDAVSMKESGLLAWHFLSNMGDAFRVFLSAMKSGPADWNVKFDLTNPNERALSKEAFNAHGNLGAMIDYMGTAVNLPGKLLISFDEAFKGLVVRGETRALAWRKASNKFRHSDLSKADIKVRVQREFDEIMNNLELHDEITEGARATAAKNSFTNDLPDKMVKDHNGVEKPVPGMSKSVQMALDRNNLMKIFIPFFRTPVNILNFTWERTPILQFFNSQLRKELKNPDPAIRQVARARVGTSMALVGSVYSLALSGKFTGAPPEDRNLRKNMENKMGGNHWYSFHAFGKWRKYDRIDPFGALLSATASMATMSKTLMNLEGKIHATGDPYGEINEKYNEVINATFLGVAEMLKDRHYIQGISEFVSGVMGDDRGMTPMFKRVATALDPRIGFYSSFRRGITKGSRIEKPRKLQRDVGLPETQTWMEDISNELDVAWTEALRDVSPGYGKISPEKDIMGNIVNHPGTSGEFDTIHNIYEQLGYKITPDLIQSKDPVINKLSDLESTIEQPSSVKKIGNTVMTEQEKDFFIDAWTGLNKERLSKMVKSSYFTKQGDGIQKLMLENIIKANKGAAKMRTMTEFPRIKQGFTDHKIFDAQRKINPDKPKFQPELFK